MTRRFFLVCGAVLIAASLCASDFPHVTILGTNGVIVPAEFAEKNRLPFQGFWTPDKEQLEELEAALPEFLQGESKRQPSSQDLIELLSKAGKSRRQYLGIIVEGKKVIWVNCFPEKRPMEDDPFAQWDSNIIVVRDGGSDFWGLIYEPDEHCFKNLMVNGTG
jgi:hypothetical protein